MFKVRLMEIMNEQYPMELQTLYEEEDIDHLPFKTGTFFDGVTNYLKFQSFSRHLDGCRTSKYWLFVTGEEGGREVMKCAEIEYFSLMAYLH